MNIGERTRIIEPVNLYGCTIGSDCLIGPFTEIQRGVVIGDHCRIQSHSFICSGVTMDKYVFVGHGVMFINDRYPTVKDAESGTWQKECTEIGHHVSIGSNATVFPVTIGDYAIIGAGAVVTHDVPAGQKVVGNPGVII